MKALLIQHGESEADLRGSFSASGYHDGLTEKGREQIRQMAYSMKEEYGTVSAIYSSPLKRAVESAEIIASVFDQPFATAEELREIPFGNYEGKLISSYKDETNRIMRKWFLERDERVSFPGGERISSGVERIISFMRRLEESEKKDIPPFLIIGHEKSLLTGIAAFTQNISGKDALKCNLKAGDIIPIIYSSIWKGWMCEHSTITSP